MDAILAHVEWSTLLFFAALFVLMEALSELGLIAWIGKQTVTIILSVGEGSRLMVAILIILWVRSTKASSRRIDWKLQILGFCVGFRFRR